MVSTELGATVYIDESKLTDAQGNVGVSAISNHGIYSNLLYGSNYPNDLISDVANTFDIKTANILSSSVTPSGATTSIKYYKMRGYYVAGLVYETWVSSISPNLTPPSGHSLTDIAIVAIWAV